MTIRFPFAPGTLKPGLRLSLGLLLAATSPRVLAQADDDPDGPTTISRPVVQSTAASPTRDLNAALSRLAADPRNVVALYDAADAALRMGDSDAAIGFLSRANEIQPGNPRAQSLIGKAYLLAENPVDAVRAFDEAERAGGDTFAMASDRALAYDLVGDNGRAQRWYQVALSRGPNDELTRRYALSLAISGDRRGAEALIAPLIARQDRATWRTRTFVMAVTGGPDEAVAVAYASMPQELAAGIAPYLRYMPRLTPAQQAAAANFGRFPRAADIGRDDPRVVQYAGLNPRAPRAADAGLVPAGTPLGSSSEKPSREKRRRPGKDDRALAAARTSTSSAVTAGRIEAPGTTPLPAAPRPGFSNSAIASATPAAPVATPAPPAARPTVLSVLDLPPGAARPDAAPIRPLAPPSTAGSTSPALAPQTSTIRPLTPPASAPAPVPVQPSLAAPAPSAQVAASTVAPPTSAPRPAPTPVNPLAMPPVQPGTPSGATVPRPAPGFDLARVGGSTSAVSAPAITIPLPVSTPLAASPAVAPTASANVVPSQAPAASPPPASPASAVAEPVQLATATPPAPTRIPESTEPPSRPVDFASMFKSFTPPEEEREPVVAAVDITRLPPKPAPKPVKADPRGERPDGPSDVSRTSAKEPEKAPAKDSRTGKDAKTAKDAKAEKDAKDAKAKKSAPSHPSRIWVQVLLGGNKDMMDNEWRRLVKDAPEILRGRKPYISPLRGNFRLLTGPFESEAAAQEFITRLRKSGVSSYQWTSPAGQAVDTLALK